jgi:hypothetical protein
MLLAKITLIYLQKVNEGRLIMKSARKYSIILKSFVCFKTLYYSLYLVP